MGTDINIKKKIAAKEEGVTITNDLSSLNFVGAGVTASIIGDEVTVTVPGSIGATTYYLNESITQAPYKEFSSVPTSAAEQTIANTVSAGSTITVESFQTPTGIPNTTNIPAGLWQFYLHFSGTFGDSWDIYVEVYKRDLGGIETLLLTTDLIPTTSLNAIPLMILTDGVFAAATVLTTDRIVVKVKATNSGVANQTITFHTEGSTNYSVATTTLNQVVGAGSVTSVTGTAPIASSGGTTPAISISQATTATDGYLSSTDWNTFNSKRGQGVWGIANASGQYTFYSTFATVLAASVVGDTIELFADYNDAGDATYILKDQVNINFHGHRFFYSTTVAGPFYLFTDNGVAINVELFNCNVQADLLSTTDFVMNMTGASQISISGILISNRKCLQFNNSSGILRGGTFQGSFSDSVTLIAGLLENIEGVSGNSRGIYVINGTLKNSIGRSSSGQGIGLTNSGSRAFDCTGMSTTGTGIILTASSFASNCSAVSGSSFQAFQVGNSFAISCSSINTGTGVGYTVTSSTLTNCTAYASANHGFSISSTNSRLLNCSGYTATGNAILVNLGSTGNLLDNCSGYSAAGSAIKVFGTNKINNCTGYSTTSYGFELNDLVSVGPSTYGSIVITNSSGIGPAGSGAIVTVGGTNINIYNSNFESGYNDPNGGAIVLSQAGSGVLNIVNNTFTVANTLAQALWSVGVAANVKYGSNIYFNSTTPVDPFITQTLVNTEDNQGNILL